MVFNVLAHNRDDHAKNFAFLMNEHGSWSLSPAYDLNFAEGPGGEHTTTFAGEGKRISRSHLLKLAQAAGVSPDTVDQMIDHVADAVSSWPETSKKLGITSTKSKALADRLDHCRKSLS